MSFLVEAGYEDGATATDPAGNPVTYDGSLEFEVTDLGTMTLHIGANMDQNMEVRISEVSCESLYIDDLDVTTVTGADRAMASLDEAIAQVSEVRSRLGAYENRLEYSTESLDAFEENMTGAMSRLTDVDMAEEIGMRSMDGVPAVEGSRDRSAERTPMQWGAGPTAGFSTCAPEKAMPIAFVK